jgi:hypothetical protein
LPAEQPFPFNWPLIASEGSSARKQGDFQTRWPTPARFFRQNGASSHTKLRSR